jgi:hypothetical protein
MFNAWPRCSLSADQPIEVETVRWAAEQVYRDGMGSQVIIRAATCNITEQVNGPGGRVARDRRRITRIMSFSAGFDRYTGVQRLY